MLGNENEQIRPIVPLYQPKPRNPSWKRLARIQKENHRPGGMMAGKRKENVSLEAQEVILNECTDKKKRKLVREDNEVVKMEEGYNYIASNRQANREP